MAGPTRFELATSGVTGRRSNQLNYDPAVVLFEGSILPQAGLFCKAEYLRRQLLTTLLAKATCGSCPDVPVKFDPGVARPPGQEQKKMVG